MVTLHATRYWVMAAFGACLLAPLAADGAASAPERVLCVPDQTGALRVLVLMPPARWPSGGFRIEANGKTLARMGVDSKALSQLPEEEREALRRLPARARKAKSSAASVIIYGRLLSDWRFARAAGMGGIFPGAPRNIKSVKIQPLSAGGRPKEGLLACRPGPSKPPPAPAGLRAVSIENGVLLYWQPFGKHTFPVLSYRVARDTGGGAKPLMLQAPFLPFAHKEKQPAYMDRLPPLEQEITYQVRWVDPLGRKGPWARVRVYSTDFTALRPPARVTAKIDKDSVTLHWPKSDNPRTAGYVVERAYLNTGPYEVLTPKGLPTNRPEYRDSKLKGGTLYFYRVRAMGPHGDLGVPSDPVAAQARSTAVPSAPQRLKADVGRTRVRLSWELLPGNVAGYIIERRAKGSPRWSRLNATLRQPPRYDDLLGPQIGGMLAYRVTAVSQDNLKSAPSKIVKVRLIDTTPPLPPRIGTASGADGKVTLGLQAAAPAKDTARIYVLRGGSVDDPGLVIGKPLPGDAGRFEDTWVQPGKVYWYHLVAADAAGNRSADGQAVEVRVASPLLPKPPVPKVIFVAKPISVVRLTFAKPPPRLTIIVQASLDGTHWRAVAGPTTEAGAQDLNPGTGATRYRIRYRTANGSLGPPSASVVAQRP